MAQSRNPLFDGPGMPFTELPEMGAEGKLFQRLTNPDGSAPGDASIDYASRVAGMIDDAREFNAEVLTPIRVTGIQFYLGLVPALDAEGQSTIVATEVRDTVLQMLPSLMRLFTAQNSAVVFIPNNKPSAKMAKQQTDYINYVWQYDNPGYMILQDVLKDGMIKAMGVAQWWTDDNLEVVEETYERLSLEQRQYVISQPGTEVVKMEPVAVPGPQGEIIPRFNITVRLNKRAPQHRVSSVPPDEFRINRTATCIKDAALVGRERFATQSELLRKGVPLDLITLHRDFSGGDMRFTEERMLRNQGADSAFGRDSMEPVVRYGEYWIRVDKDLDGLAELRHICTVGDNHEIVMDEPASRAKMAIACPDPEPHSIVGHSVAELVADLQVIKTNLLRGSLDSLASSIYPRVWGVENLVNWDDVLNQAIGAPIRVKDANAIGQFSYQFVGDPAFQMMDRLDAIRMARTGVTEQSKGLDPKALQSTTLKGVEMIVTGAQERIELVARTMAHTFMVDLFSGLLQEVIDHPSPQRVVKLCGEYIEVNPDQFDATMNCVPNAAIGKGSDLDRFMILNTILQKQEMIIQQMGPGNPMVSPIEWRNAVEDLLALAGERDSERYFKAINPEALQAFLQQLQAKEDPNMVLAKAEADKVRAEVVKILTDARVKATEIETKDDRERDKNEADQLLKAAEIDAKYGAAVDTAAIRTLWAAPRIPPGMDRGGPEGGGGDPGMAPPPVQPPVMPEQKPALPQRTALGAGPPKLLEQANGPPAGLISGAGPGAGSGLPPGP